MNLLYTKHAKTRMEERNITPATVRAIVLHGMQVEQDHGTQRLDLLGFSVVLDGCKVVTVYEDK